MLSVVSGYSSMSCFSFDATISGYKNTCHKSETSIALCHNVGLDISIIILAGPQETSLTLYHVCHHIIDQSVLIPELSALKFRAVFTLINVLEDVLEATIILLQNCILC